MSTRRRTTEAGISGGDSAVETPGDPAAPAVPVSRASAVWQSWRGLVYQLAGILLAFLALVIWLLTANLSPIELTTLAPDALWVYTVQHIQLTLLAAVIVLVIAIPLGIALTRRSLRFLTAPVLAIANVGQAAPAIGVVVLLAFWVGFGFWAATLSLVLYAVLPVLRNTMVGLQQVDARLIEAGRGMGMSSTAVLFRVELPLAVPVMLSGVRTALVLLVGTAALATFVNGGGLGILITTGVNLSLTPVLVTGALLVALLALLIDWIGRVAEHVARPKGL
ncbi:osmoprotectant transport system permease protein [Cryobacterium flavum]|uniref:ABC transporter permease n=1 Tax=Cryobacterium flavum TaxID=1424659 RepID=A0A4R8V6J7_9MICO|nr:ABC transporter permease [Cryobacterium flavum]TFB77660.1 ABC transporter permease [Cryobacterium flavum]SDM53471.1 osmoprotectant transport system permease protein [Cryobacterium flavum]